MKNDLKIAEEILKAIGGKENISFVAHCMTRLRLNFKDESLIDEKAIKDIDGVIGLNKVGIQFQIIIGQNVDKVYLEICNLAGLKPEKTINENLDENEKKKFSLRRLGSQLLDYISVSMFSITPILMIAGLCKCLCVVLGPVMLNLITEESNFYILMNAVYNAGFYFLPIFAGYSAAKKMGIPPTMGLILGAVLIEPSILGLADKSINVYGIPAQIYDYSSTIMPIILSVYAMSYVYKFIDKKLPDALRNFSGFICMLIALPVTLCLLAPLGNILGNALVSVMTSFYSTFGVFAVVIMCAFSTLLTISGMHVALGTISAVQIISTAYDPFFFVAGITSNYTIMGMCLASWLKIKEKKEKANALGYFVSSFFGGVTEPGLYGLAVKYKTPFIGIIAGGGAAGLLAGLTGTAVRMFPPASNFIAGMAFFFDTSESIIFGVLTCIVAFVVSAVVTYFFGYRNIDVAKENSKETN